jgi:hypothetical protein
MMEIVPDSALVEKLRPQFIDELTRLRQWTMGNGAGAELTKEINDCVH